VCIFTKGKGQSPSNNLKVAQTVCGHIVGPGPLKDTAHRIPVCRGTSVSATVEGSQAPGFPSPNSANMGCVGNTCSVTDIQATEKYIARSADGSDTDRMTFILAK
jgi:hypothetical protein